MPLPTKRKVGFFSTDTPLYLDHMVTDMNELLFNWVMSLQINIARVTAQSSSLTYVFGNFLRQCHSYSKKPGFIRAEHQLRISLKGPHWSGNKKTKCKCEQCGCIKPLYLQVWRIGEKQATTCLVSFVPGTRNLVSCPRLLICLPAQLLTHPSACLHMSLFSFYWSGFAVSSCLALCVC